MCNLGSNYSIFGSTIPAIIDAGKNTFRLKLLKDTSFHQDIIYLHTETKLSKKLGRRFLNCKFLWVLIFWIVDGLPFYTLILLGFWAVSVLQVKYLCYVVTWSSPYSSPRHKFEVNNSVLGDYLTWLTA